jgi:hypothetical protein
MLGLVIILEQVLFADLLGQCAPDAEFCVGLPTVKADDAHLPKFVAGRMIAEHLFP